jgi:hypothetical protein
MNYDSGKKRGYRKTKGGRANVRSVLYMSTLVGHTPQPTDPSAIPAIVEARQGEESCAHCLYAQVPHHLERYAA